MSEMTADNLLLDALHNERFSTAEEVSYWCTRYKAISLRFAAELKDLRAQLAASQEDVKKWQGLHSAMETLYKTACKRAGRATQRIEEAEKCEPVAWYEAEASARNENIRNVVGRMLYSTRIHYAKPQTSNPVWPLFARPVPPADVAELRAEADTYKVLISQLREELLSDRLAADTQAHIAQERIAELERKLAEKQAIVQQAIALMEPLKNYLPEKHIQRWMECILSPADHFNALLAQARNAVPDGWQLVPKEPTKAMIKSATKANTRWQQDPKDKSNGFSVMYTSMIAAAPAPQALNVKEGGE